MQVRILGAAAGGGLPQWNCRCPNCRAVRAGSPEVVPRTQSSVAVSADGMAWFLLNVSPDIRQQILAFPALGPAADGAGRSTGIAGCVLTDAELDHVGGLLLLREGCAFGIACTSLVRRWLNQYLPIEPLLAGFADRCWLDVPVAEPTDLMLPSGAASGLRLTAFAVDPHSPRFVPESETAGSVVGLRIEDLNTGGKLVYAPCVGSLCPGLLRAVRDADVLLMDGTFWADDEPIRMGITTRTARMMGHLPVSGPGGSLEWLRDLPVRHRVYIHINNTNPMLNSSSPEAQLATESGIKVGADGDQFTL